MLPTFSPNGILLNPSAGLHVLSMLDLPEFQHVRSLEYMNVVTTAIRSTDKNSEFDSVVETIATFSDGYNNFRCSRQWNELGVGGMPFGHYFLLRVFVGFVDLLDLGDEPCETQVEKFKKRGPWSTLPIHAFCVSSIIMCGSKGFGGPRRNSNNDDDEDDDDDDKKDGRNMLA